MELAKRERENVQKEIFNYILNRVYLIAHHIYVNEYVYAELTTIGTIIATFMI